jgi:hypothetical protein
VHQHFRLQRPRPAWLPLVLVAQALTLGFSGGCGDTVPLPSQAVSAPTRAPATLPRLTISGTQFTTLSGASFEWRGITAFRLADYIADGDEASAIRFLDWAAKQKLTIVRVLTMMGGLFELRPEDGRRALPRLLQLAAERGLYVEVVALAGTADIPVNLEEHIREIGTILASHPNGVLEIANEPVHPSQAAAVQKPEVLKNLASLAPAAVPVSLGSIERGDGFGAGTYITWHSPRDGGRDGWKHVTALTQGAELIARWKKPVVSDEPIGAGPKREPGRRDDSPDRFRVAALLTRLTGAGATFHYESGIQARVPEGREIECFNAWNEAWTLLPADLERKGSFAGDASSTVYRRVDSSSGWVLVLGDGTQVKLADGWRVVRTVTIGGGALLEVAAR